MPDDASIGTLPHWTKFLWNIRQIEHPAPALYEIDLTNYCNLKCPWCISSVLRQKTPKNMPMVRVAWILLKAAWHRVGITITGGGESTLHPQFERIVKWIKWFLLKRRILALGVVTNGARPDRLAFLLDQTHDFAEKNIPVWIRISINDRLIQLQPELHQFLFKYPRQCGLSFVWETEEQKHTCERNIEYLKKMDFGKYYRLKRVHDLTKSHPPGFAFLCMGRKLHQIHEPDGNIPFCCMQRGQGHEPPQVCPLSCPWGQPTQKLIWEAGPFS